MSKRNDEGGVWRTVGGRRIFIKDGQDLETAMYESGKFDEIIHRNRMKRKKQIKLSKKEYAIVIHEINTYYGKNESRPTLGKCVNDYYYVFKNNGFNNYVFLAKMKIVPENKGVIKAISEVLNNE
jgi:hypothetical protein